MWLSPTWLPAYSVRLTVAQPELKRLKSLLRSTTLDNLYEALGGTFLGTVPGPWEQVQIDHTTSLRPTMRDTKVHAAVRKAVQDYERVSSPSAVQRHASRLAELGVPTPCSALSIDQTSLVYVPYYVGILDGDGRQRAVAVTGRTGDLSDLVSRVLTANLAQLRTHFAR